MMTNELLRALAAEVDLGDIAAVRIGDFAAQAGQPLDRWQMEVVRRAFGRFDAALVPDSTALAQADEDGQVRIALHTSSPGLTTPADLASDVRVVDLTPYVSAVTFLPSGPPSTTSVLDAIDAATNDLCACGCGAGLDPLGVSAYFASVDCQTRWHARQTTNPHQVRGSQFVDADQMRWRPDLVSAEPDVDLEPVDAPEVVRSYFGAFAVSVSRRTSTGGLHVRLDDGHRFVGADVPDGESLAGVWARLDRELTDPRRLGVGRNRRTHHHAVDDARRQRVADWLAANGLDTDLIPLDSPIFTTATRIAVQEHQRDADGRSCFDDTGRPATTLRTVPLVVPWPAGLHWPNHTDESDIDRWRDTFTQLGAAVNTCMRHLAESLTPALEQLRRACAAHEQSTEPDPMRRLIAERRRGLGAGPRARERAPRRIDPRRGL